jgi:hypothetical protein
MIAIRVWDITSSRSQQVEAPDDVDVARLLVLLVERMRLPLNSPDGQIMSYKLHHKRTGRQLLDNETLADANVQQGDDLRLQPEITAGGGRACERPPRPVHVTERRSGQAIFPVT